MCTLAFAGLSMQEMLIILLIVLVLFGASKIPQMMKGFGQGIKEFKKGMKEDDDDSKKAAAKTGGAADEKGGNGTGPA